MTNHACGIKSVRKDIIADITEKMADDEAYHNIANMFKLLGDFSRVRILCALNHQEFCVCELSLLLDMSQSAISHQLRLLRNKNIVKYRKENKQVFYSLKNKEIMKIIKKVGSYEF